MAYNRNNKHEDIYTVDILFFVQAAKMCFFNTDFFMHKVTVGYFCTHTYIHVSQNLEIATNKKILQLSYKCVKRFMSVYLLRMGIGI